MSTSVKVNLKKMLKTNYDGKRYDGEELLTFVEVITKKYISKYDDISSDEFIKMLSNYVHYSVKKDDYYIKSTALNSKNNTMYEILSEAKDEDCDTLDLEEESESESEEGMIIEVKEIIYDKSKPYFRKKKYANRKYKYADAHNFTPEKKTLEQHGEAYGPFGSQWIHDKQIDDVWGPDEERRAKEFDRLRNIVLPEQRSKEWFKMREGKITASDLGCLLGDNHYEAPYKFILKKIDPPPFNSNIYCYHGKKYEEIATMVYQYRMNVIVEEFGLMGDKTIPFIGASPDGICSPYKMDGIHKSKLVGRMLEIKCPYVRKIKTSGPIKDHICPVYYWDQVQQQLQCCDLDECDFWQAQIEEYKSRYTFLADTNPDEPFRSIETGHEKGVLIQLLSHESLEACIEDKEIIVNGEKKTIKSKNIKKYWEEVYNKAIFIYPKKIEMSPEECDKWIAEQVSTYKLQKDDKGKSKYYNYEFDRVFYWKMVLTNNVVIKRDHVWFKKALPKMKKMWNYVKKLRTNPEIKQLVIDYVKSLNIKKNDHILKVYEIVTDPEHKEYNEMINKMKKMINIKKMSLMRDEELLKKANDESNNDLEVTNNCSYDLEDDNDFEIIDDYE